MAGALDVDSHYPIHLLPSSDGFTFMGNLVEVCSPTLSDEIAGDSSRWCSLLDPS